MAGLRGQSKFNSKIRKMKELMNFLNKSFSVSIFFILATNISFATPAEIDLEKAQKNTIHTKRQNNSKLKRVYSKVINMVKARTNFVKSNPKKCLMITAAAVIISSAILYWYLGQITPSKTWKQIQAEDEYNIYKTFSECPNNKDLEEAMIDLKRNHVRLDYTKKPSTDFEWCVYHDAGNQAIRTYCDPKRLNDNAQNIHLMPAEIDYIYEHGNQIVKQAIDYLKSMATRFCNRPDIRSKAEFHQETSSH